MSETDKFDRANEATQKSAALGVRDILRMGWDIIICSVPEVYPLTPEMEAVFKPSFDAADKDLLEGRTISLDELIKQAK